MTPRSVPFMPSMRTAGRRHLSLSDQTRTTLCIGSAVLGLVSLWTGLYGQGIAWRAVSAVTGTISVGTAVLYAKNQPVH